MHFAGGTTSILSGSGTGGRLRRWPGEQEAMTWLTNQSPSTVPRS